MGKPHPVSMKSSTKLNRSVTTVAAAAEVADASSISATIGKATAMDARKRTGRIANTTSLLGSIRRASRRSGPGLEGSGHVIARASAAPSIVPQFTESRFGVTVGVKPPRGRPFRVKSWSGRRDSNPLPQPWEGRALPGELLPLGRQTSLGFYDRLRLRRRLRHHRPDQLRILLHQPARMCRIDRGGDHVVLRAFGVRRDEHPAV